MSRKLYWFPVIHTSAELGKLATQVQKRKAETLPTERLRHAEKQIANFWAELFEVVLDLCHDPTAVSIYQDGLPVSGVEEKIVRDLAEGGSPNHRLVLKLVEQGAQLIGTESAELLLEEYRLLTQQVASETPEDKLRRARTAETLLHRRDRFIGERVSETLEPGRVGILFLGMLHDVVPFLADDIEVARQLPPSFTPASPSDNA